MKRTIYKVRARDGRVIAEHVRIDYPDGSKITPWQLPDGTRGLGELHPSDLPLYGTERLASLEVGRTVLACEGEKATEACWRMGYPAVGTVTGASGTPDEDALAVLLPFDVVLWPDHDDQGQRHMARVATSLVRLGGSCRLLGWGVEKGDDAADFQGTLTDLDLFVRNAPDYHPTVEEVVQRPAYAPTPTQWRADGTRIERAREQLESVVAARLGPPKRADRRSLWWPCPFHADRSPSFKVDVPGNFFKCFGCDAKGDALTFVEKLDGVGFADALRELAPVGLGGIPRFGA